MNLKGSKEEYVGGVGGRKKEECHNYMKILKVKNKHLV